MAQPIKTVSNSLEGQLFEVVTALSAAQANKETNTANVTVVNFNYNTNQKQITGNFAIPYQETITETGSVQLTPTEALP